jgi:cell wall-associated NlpC family hydrolase
VVGPRDSWQQEEGGEGVSEHELEPGDVLCYPDHVAFWLGDGWIQHASSGARAVVEEREPPELASERRAARRFPRKARKRAPSN